MQIISLLHIN